MSCFVFVLTCSLLHDSSKLSLASKFHTKNYSIGNIKSSLDFSYITGILYYVVCESYALQYLLESLLVNVFFA